MCDINVYLIQNGDEVLVMENVDQVEESQTENNTIKIINLFGEEKSITGKMVSFNNSKKKMVFDPAG